MNSEETVQTVIRLIALIGTSIYWGWWCKSLIKMVEVSGTGLCLGTFFGGVVLSIFTSAIIYNKIRH